jgi:hypothetical protein
MHLNDYMILFGMDLGRPRRYGFSKFAMKHIGTVGDVVQSSSVSSLF